MGLPDRTRSTRPNCRKIRHRLCADIVEHVEAADGSEFRAKVAEHEADHVLGLAAAEVGFAAGAKGLNAKNGNDEHDGAGGGSERRTLPAAAVRALEREAGSGGF